MVEQIVNEIVEESDMNVLFKKFGLKMRVNGKNTLSITAPYELSIYIENNHSMANIHLDNVTVYDLNDNSNIDVLTEQKLRKTTVITLNGKGKTTMYKSKVHW